MYFHRKDLIIPHVSVVHTIDVQLGFLLDLLRQASDDRRTFSAIGRVMDRINVDFLHHLLSGID